MPLSATKTQSTIHRLSTVLSMHPIFATLLGQILSWRTLAIVLALLNLKSLPFAWHLRVFTLVFRHGRSVLRNRKFLEHQSSPSLSATRLRIHPIFRPVSITSRTSLYETDYNIHKSNSTYFADLDHSRSALVASLIGPSLARSTLVKYGEKPGVLYPILGSVHASFLREIKPLQAYTIRSRLLGWDRKWLIVLSCFVRPATKAEIAKAKKDDGNSGNIATTVNSTNIVNQGEVLLACALNKYVIKQGRKTVEPGLALAGSGWYRARPGVTHAVPNSNANSDLTSVPSSQSPQYQQESSSASSAISSTPGNNTPLPTPSQATINAAETVSRVVRRLSRAAEDEDKPAVELDTASITATTTTTATTQDNEELGGWTWDEINEERLRGLKIAQGWLALDSDLRNEYLKNLDIL